jgi:hypothetical protein
LLPNATLFLLLLCNDREVLGPLANSRWMNVIAAAVTGALLALSALLIMTTAAPGIRASPPVVGLTIAIAALVACGTLSAVRSTPPASPAAGGSRTWTMPPIESLKPPQRSPLRTLGLIALRCYMLAAVAALVARTVRIMLGSGLHRARARGTRDGDFRRAAPGMGSLHTEAALMKESMPSMMRCSPNLKERAGSCAAPYSAPAALPTRTAVG